MEAREEQRINMLLQTVANQRTQAMNEIANLSVTIAELQAENEELEAKLAALTASQETE